MLKAPVLENESERHQKLVAYDVLDTESEDIFDEVTKTAAALCNAKISLVSLIDSHRQWFKSAHGLDASETPRDISFCGHTIASDDVMVIEDAADDDRFCDNPLYLGEPHVKFYAGAPLITPDGFRIGTLCVIDSEKKTLNDQQIMALKSLSKQVINYLELKLSNLKLTKLKHTIDTQNIKFKNILTSLLEGLIVQSESGEVIIHNPAALKILGISEGQLTGKEFLIPRWQSTYEDGTPFTSNHHPAMIAYKMKQTIKNDIVCVKDDTNEPRWISINSTPAVTEEGINTITTFADITATRKLQQETKFILNSMQVGTWKWDVKNDVLDWDDSNYKIFKIKKSDFTGAKEAWVSRLHPNSKEKAMKDFYDALEGKREFNTTFEIITPDGTQCFLGGKGEVFRDDDGHPVRMVGINWDKTKEHLDSLELEQQKKLAQHHTKLASIGELAAGVGHEINNPLAIAKGFLFSLSKKITSDDQSMTTTFVKVNNALDRIAVIVKGLRTFSRVDDVELVNFDVLETLDESISLIEDMYKSEGITLINNINLVDKSLGAHGNKGKLQQIFMNLLSNAKDAVRVSDEKILSISATLSDNKLRILFTDTGCGIPQNIIDNIFDPFFTTKDVNEGTGIGLSLVYNFINEFGGTISVSSEESKGSEFIVELPVSAFENEVVTVEEGKNMSDPQIAYSVIIADDEEGIREILQMYLEDMGITVTTAENGKQALDFYLEDPVQYDMIISDIKMPEMDGVTLLKTIRNDKSLKQPKFIFITGGINIDLEASDNELIKLIDAHFYKPFDREQIFDTLKRLAQ